MFHGLDKKETGEIPSGREVWESGPLLISKRDKEMPFAFRVLEPVLNTKSAGMCVQAPFKYSNF